MAYLLPAGARKASSTSMMVCCGLPASKDAKSTEVLVSVLGWCKVHALQQLVEALQERLNQELSTVVR